MTTWEDWVNMKDDDALPANLTEAWERLFAGPPPPLGATNTYDAVFDHPVLFPLQRPAELGAMLKLMREGAYPPRVVYEIGADKGGGFYHLCRALPTVRKAAACEIRGTPYEGPFRAAFPSIDFLFLAESSYALQGQEKLLQWLKDDLIDVLFIDGDKSAFWLDFALHLPLMSRRGQVFLHDFRDPAPSAAVARIRRSGHALRTHVDTSDYERSVARGGSPKSCHDGWLRHWKGQSCGWAMVQL